MAIDLLFLIFGLFGFYLGFNRGIIKTIFTFLSYGLGFVAAVKFAPSMTKFLQTLTKYDSSLLFMGGFVLSLLLTIFFMRWIANQLENILQSANINIINRMLGGALLASVMILVYSYLLKFYNVSGGISQVDKEESFFYAFLETYPDQVWKLMGVLKPTFKEFWEYCVDFLDGVRDIGRESLDKTSSDPIIRDIDE